MRSIFVLISVFSAKRIAKRAVSATKTLDTATKACLEALDSEDPAEMERLRELERAKAGLVRDEVEDADTDGDRYFGALKTYYEKTRAGPARTFGARTQLALLMENVQELEAKLQLTEPWAVGSTEWLHYEKRQVLVAFKKAANKLQSLIHAGKTHFFLKFWLNMAYMSFKLNSNTYLLFTAMVEKYHLQREHVGQKMAAVLRDRVNKTYASINDTIATYNAELQKLRQILGPSESLPEMAAKSIVHDQTSSFWESVMRWRGSATRSVTPSVAVALTHLRQSMRASEELVYLRHEARNFARWVYDVNDALVKAVNSKIITDDHALFVENANLKRNLELNFSKSVPWLKELVRGESVAPLLDYDVPEEFLFSSSDDSCSSDGDSD